MMQRSLPLLLVGLFVVACTDSRTTEPTHSHEAPSVPRFTALPTPCDPVVLNDLNVLATAMFATDADGQQSVLSKLRNINASCVFERPSTQAQVKALQQFLLQKLGAGSLTDPEAGPPTLQGHVADFLTKLFIFAGSKISGAATATPGSPVTVVTSDQTAGVFVPAGAVSQEVVIIITPLADNTNLPNNPYPTYPPAVDITTSIGPMTFAVPILVGLCEDPSVPTNVQPNLRIGHGLTNNTTEILPLAPPPNFLACYGPLAMNEPLHFDRHHLLGSAQRLVAWAGRHVADVFTPKNAYALHGGLGGLTSSLSPFKAVDVGGASIAFESTRDIAGGDIYTMNPDGTTQTRITNSRATKCCAVWSPDHSKIVFADTISGNVQIFVMDANGSNLQQLTTFLPGTNALPSAWSPDGTKILFIRGSPQKVWVMNANGGSPTQLTFGASQDLHPRFSPDGSTIVLATDALTVPFNFRIATMPATGGVMTPLTFSGGVLDTDPVYSPTGNKIAFARYDGANYSIFTMDANGANQLQRTFVGTDGSNRQPVYNPIGTRIAFESTRDGNLEIYVMNPLGTGQTRLTFNAVPDQNPAWR